MTRTGAAGGSVRSLLSDSRLVEAGYVSEAGLRAAVERFEEGAPAREDVWRLVCLERWLRAVEGLAGGEASGEEGGGSGEAGGGSGEAGGP